MGLLLGCIEFGKAYKLDIKERYKKMVCGGLWIVAPGALASNGDIYRLQLMGSRRGLVSVVGNAVLDYEGGFRYVGVFDHCEIPLKPFAKRDHRLFAINLIRYTDIRAHNDVEILFDGIMG